MYALNSTYILAKINLTLVGKRSTGRPKDVAANGGKRARCVWVEIMGRGGTEGG